MCCLKRGSLLKSLRHTEQICTCGIFKARHEAGPGGVLLLVPVDLPPVGFGVLVAIFPALTGCKGGGDGRGDGGGGVGAEPFTPLMLSLFTKVRCTGFSR